VSKVSLALLFLCAVLGACSRAGGGTEGHAAASAPIRIVLQTDWYAEPEHGGFYQALVRGYYRDAGLDVEIVQGSPSAKPLVVVATGKADFGISRSDELIVAVSRGIPVEIAGALMERDPQAILYHEGSGIRGFRDLNGRTLMAVPGSNFISVIEQIYGIRLSVVPSDFGITRFVATPDLLTQCFVTNEPYYARKLGAKVGVLLLSEGGFSPYRVWFTRRSFAEAHPDIVRAFTAASIRGWREYVAGDRSEADARLEALNPKMTPDFIAYSVGAMRSYHLIDGNAKEGDEPGRVRPQRIAREIEQLRALKLLDRPVTVDEVLDSAAGGDP
jgi:NitT/TauT family transport system substrate-binding protein